MKVVSRILEERSQRCVIVSSARGGKDLCGFGRRLTHALGGDHIPQDEAGDHPVVEGEEEEAPVSGSEAEVKVRRRDILKILDPTGGDECPIPGCQDMASDVAVRGRDDEEEASQLLTAESSFNSFEVRACSLGPWASPEDRDWERA